MRHAALALGLLAFGAVACGTETASTGGAKAAPAAMSAQDFTTRDVDGKTVRMSDHLGKEIILVNFWSTFCQPCLAQFPHVQRLYDAKKAQGFTVLAVSMDGSETIQNVPAFAKRNGLTFPVLLDEDSRIASLYNPKKAEPLTVLIDKSGKIVKVREGYNPGDEKLLEAEVDKLLAGETL